MDVAFLLWKLPCSKNPRLIPTERIKNMNRDLDIDSVRNKKSQLNGVTLCVMNKPVVRSARSTPIFSGSAALCSCACA